MDAIVSSKANPAYQRAGSLSPQVPRNLARRLLFLPDKARNMGIHVMAGKGAGKSRLLGRIIAWFDFLRGIPLIVMDPHGPVIDNFLDMTARLPRVYQEVLWPRVVYVDMSGRNGQVVPFPLYYRLGSESLYQVSQRYLDIVRKVDPWLMTASIEGFNALWNIGTYSGMILTALDFQITEAGHLVANPKAWSSRFTQAIKNNPEARPAVDFFNQQFNQWPQSVRDKRSNSYLTKIALFNLDPTMKAMFGASDPGIDWNRVMGERLAVLIDFRHEHDQERRRFKMLWAFHFLLDFIKSRGAGRHIPISLIIDELSALTNWQTLGVDIFAADLDELINVIARNYMVWLTLAHQELFQLEERTQKTVMAMGTQIIGSTSDHEAAMALAQQLYRYHPGWVHKWDPVYWEISPFVSMEPGPQIIDWIPEFYTPEEQDRLNSNRVRDQERFHFLVRPAPEEGTMTHKVYPITIENFDRGLYINEELVAQARTILSKKCGTPIDEILPDIHARLERKKLKVKRPSAKNLIEGSQDGRSDD